MSTSRIIITSVTTPAITLLMLAAVFAASAHGAAPKLSGLGRPAGHAAASTLSTPADTGWSGVTSPAGTDDTGWSY
jgi:hypothetical protein